MDPEEERKIEDKIKKENDVGGVKDSYAGVANGLPNEKDRRGNKDALNANFYNGQVQGTHGTNINTQTDLELGGLMDPGGIDPAMDEQYLQKMQKDLRRNR